MSGAWPRNYQGPSSFKPGASAGSPPTTPDVSVRNHKKWRAAFDKLLADYLARGHSGVEDLARYTRRAINAVLDSQPTAESFKSFQVISDIIDALAHGPIAYAKAECTRRDLINLTNLGPGRLYVRGIYRLFPIDHKGFENDKEFDVFLIRRGISLWPVTINPADSNNNNNNSNSHRRVATPARADIVIPVKRHLESGSGGGFGGLGASHYSPPPRPRPMPPGRWGRGEGDTMSINELLNTSSKGGSGVPTAAPSGPSASIPTAIPVNFTAGGALADKTHSSSSVKGGSASEKETINSSVLVPSSASSDRHTTIQENDTEKMEKMFEHFTKSIAEQQKENLTLSNRNAELEANLKKAEEELAALKQGADADQMTKFVEEKKTLVREQNRLALDKARFTAQVSNWVEKLGQVQQGLSAHLPRNPKSEDLKEGELI